VKLPLLFLSAAAAVFLSSCTTLENRRDLYSPQYVWGPYSKMLHNGIPKTTTTTSTTTTTATSTSTSDYKNVVR